MHNLLKKCSYFDKKIVFLMLIFREEGYLYANCFFYIRAFYPKYLSVRSINRGIRMHIPILTGGSKKPQ